MGIVIRIKGADFSGSGLPKLKTLRAGFPTEGLQGLYLFEEGEAGAAHAGQFIDSSGKGNHAAIRANWLQPTKRSYGMEGAAGGIAIVLPFNFGQSFTCAMAVALPTEPEPASGARYPIILAAANDVGATPASAANGASGNALINSQIAAGGGFSWDWGVTRTGGIIQGSTTLRTSVPGTVGASKTPSVIGVHYDAATTQFVLRQGNNSAIATPSAQALFPAAQSPVIGVMPYGGNQAPAAGAQLMLAAFYEGGSDAFLVEVMAAAREKVAARGVAVI